MDGTRVRVLRDIDKWIMDQTAPQIFWIAGMAGTGKSAIAWTVCSRARDDPGLVLGGSFFCSRSAGSVAQRNVRCVVPTMAQLLARQSQKFSAALADELARDPDVLHKQITAQVKQLLYKPLLSLKDSRVPVLFVIDALDECGGQTSAGESDDTESHRIVSEMLEALVAFSSPSDKLPVKFLVTSRPETHIRDTPVSDEAFSTVLRLHTINKEQVTADIRLYISKRLSSSPQLRARFTGDDVDLLARLCDGLFIVAATALQHALGAGIDAAAVRFKTLLNSTRDGLSTGAAAPLDRMYTMILMSATLVDELEATKATERSSMLRLLASLLCARMMLSVTALADLTDQPIECVRASLSRLHAVIYVPDDDDEPGVRTLHASFGDYMFGRAPSHYRISNFLGHNILARGCLQRMKRADLCFNMTRNQSSFAVNAPTTTHYIASSLVYACLHWAHHIAAASTPSELDLYIEKVFWPKFLFWLEVLSVLGKLGVASGLLRIAESTVSLIL